MTTSGGSLLYESVTRDTRDGTIYLKLVNMAGQPQLLHVTLNGVSDGAPAGRAVVLTSANPQDTNTLDEPYKVVPRIMQVGGGGSSFDLELHPYSVTILPIGGHRHDQR
jgi:alpha-N-arabinofuranosidase